MPDSKRIKQEHPEGTRDPGLTEDSSPGDTNSSEESNYPAVTPEGVTVSWADGNLLTTPTDEQTSGPVGESGGETVYYQMFPATDPGQQGAPGGSMIGFSLDTKAATTQPRSPPNISIGVRRQFLRLGSVDSTDTMADVASIPTDTYSSTPSSNLLSPTPANTPATPSSTSGPSGADLPSQDIASRDDHLTVTEVLALAENWASNIGEDLPPPGSASTNRFFPDTGLELPRPPRYYDESSDDLTWSEENSGPGGVLCYSWPGWSRPGLNRPTGRGPQSPKSA